MQQIPSATDAAAAEACAAQLIEVVPLIMRTIRTLLRTHSAVELSMPQFRALRYVQMHPDCSMSAVAEHLGLSVPATSRLIESLVQDGLVARQLLVSDRRYVALRLSEHGIQIQQAANAQALHILTQLLAPLSVDERDALVAALEPLRAIFAAPHPSPEVSAPDAATPERNLSVTPRLQGRGLV